MKRVLLAAAVAATAAVLAPAAHATERCVDLGGTGVCARYGCVGDPCRIDPTTVVVYTY